MKIAVITGASSGMGREFAHQLCREDSFDEVWLIARREDRLRELAAELPFKARVLPLDLVEKDSFSEYRSALADAKPVISVLVNASGYGRFGLTDEYTLDDYSDMIDLNDKALVRMTMLSLPYMAEGSRIIELGSLSAFQPVPYINVYAASKAFVLSFSRALAAELKPRKISVTAVCPGWVKTEFFDHAEKDNGAVTYYNIMSSAADVVAKALKDSRRGKQVSVYDWRVRAQVLGVKLLPHSLVMKIWLKQQGHGDR